MCSPADPYDNGPSTSRGAKARAPSRGAASETTRAAANAAARGTNSTSGGWICKAPHLWGRSPRRFDLPRLARQINGETNDLRPTCFAQQNKPVGLRSAKL